MGDLFLGGKKAEFSFCAIPIFFSSPLVIKMADHLVISEWEMGKQDFEFSLGYMDWVCFSFRI